jgi:amino acid adenylation domain-containing protein
MDPISQDKMLNGGIAVQTNQEVWAFPLSFSQQRLWLLDQLEPGNTSYSIPWSIRLTGELHVRALENSLIEIVRRHEALRTTFKADKGEPVQLVHESVALPFQVTDLTLFGSADGELEAIRLAKEEASRPIDLENGPLVRARLIKLRESEHVLLLTLHHIVFDGWSRRVFARELAALYEAFRDNRPSSLPELRLQYADYVVWQRKNLSGKTLEKQLWFWRRRLAGAPSTLNLPTDRPRPAIQSYRGSALPVSFSSDQYGRLAAFAREREVSLFMLLLAGFQALLARYTGDEDVMVGTPIANRTHAETEDLIGLFANTLVLRGDLTGNPSFGDLLLRTKQIALDAYAHQDIPFEKLVEELNPERNLSHNPLFQVMFSLQNAPRQAIELTGLELRPLEGTVETAKFDISVFLSETGEGLRGRIEYNTDLFDIETIERLLGHYERLLAGAVENPQLRLSELPLLSEREREQVLRVWNRTQAEYPACCVHEWFQEQAARTPEAIACLFESEQLSYRELNERANQLAHYLRQMGARPGERIGIFVERSLRMLVGLLAIQKSGAAYVPIDPAYPAERIGQIVEGAQVLALLSESGLEKRLPGNCGTLAKVYLDRDQERIGSESRENPVSGVKADDTVYVIFTSGSTGKPKGVAVPHRAVVNLLASMAKELPTGAADVFPALASFAFDMCIPELYLGLVTGGRVALGRAGLAGDGKELAEFLERVGATIVHATPTTWRLLLEAGYTGAGKTRAIGAEALPPELCRRLLEAEPSLYNFYGPTETTVWSTMHHFRSPEEPVVVGRPLANTSIYLLDGHKQPVPVGVEGELYIGGAGVAQGYLEREDLTKERFVADPYEPGGRMYRTGDRARYLADGRIEYLGRADFQVKVRGYRIELGEIEAVLAQHAAVKQCVASVREETAGDQRLVAYVVLQGVATEAELRGWVKERLPEYMVPLRVVAVERFALTPNGKMDRKQLPAVEYRRAECEQKYQAARTPVEEVMAGIWAEVLKSDHVGVEDNFFHLGGHSLLGTQVVSRVREAFEVELPLRALFEAPTVEGLAARVEELRQGGCGTRLPALEPVARPERVPLSFAQQRLWLLDQLEPGNAQYNVPYVVRLQGRLDAGLLEQSLNEIVQRHEALRTRFVLREDEPEQVIDAWQPLELKRVTFGSGTAEERLEQARQLAWEEIQQPFDLARGPLLRVALYSLAPEDHVFVLNTHHIISDRWSLGVLAEELVSLYEAYRENRPSPLAELPVQYADYALWQRRYLTQEGLAPQLAFWKRHLAGAPPTLDLPFDHPLPAAATSAGAQISEIFPAELSRNLRDLSRREGVTPFMTILAALNVLLARLSGQSDLVVGTPIAARNHINAERLFGFFVNTLALRTDISEVSNFRDLLHRTRETVIAAHAHQDLPFDQLVEELKPDRGTGRNPVFQVMLIVHNAAHLRESIGDVRISAFPVPNQTAKFDFTLIVTEAAGRLRFTFEYKTGLFDASTIHRMHSHLLHLLEEVLSDPGRALPSVSLLSAAERQSLLTDWNATEREYPKNATFLDLFLSMARDDPRKTAVVCGRDKLSYSELNERSNRVANCLRSRSIGRGSLVGVFISRSINMLPALLGILKAGAAYVPIDPGYPKDRIAFVLEDTNVSLLVTERSLSEMLPAVQVPRLYLDSNWRDINTCSSAEPSETAAADSLAYVIFTSGSTGKPKGVKITHRSLLNFLLSMRMEPGLCATDVVLAIATLTFDPSTLELYLPLIVGATTVVISREETLDPKRLARVIAEVHPTLVQATPTTWRMLIEAGWSGDPRVKALCGGEPLSPDLAGQLNRRCGELWNVYGPTETTVWCSAYRVTSEPKAAIPVGRPVANARMYVLDPQRQPVPIGVVGELYVAGDGVGIGYLNRPELNAERFLENPFVDGERMYRTGDLARFLPDGNIVCLGRTDDQVKIRGHRIELGEIEVVLREHPDIEAGVAAARKNSVGETQLVAYFVSKPDRRPTAATLRAHLKNRLPDYLVPNLYQQMDSLPLTSTGKVDRRRLPEPSVVESSSSDTLRPRDGFELVLHQLWTRVLGIQSCNMTDNFFELGGHSLSLVRLAALIEKDFSRAIPMAYLFDSPTIEKMAAFLRNGTSDLSGFFVPFYTRGSGPAFFLVHSVIGDVVGCRHLVRLLDPNQRIYGIQVPPELRTSDFVSSVEQMASRYVEELLAFEPQGPYLLGGWSAGGPIALEMAQQLRARGYDVPLLVSIDAAPANTGGGTSRSSPLYSWRLLCNLPYCLKNDLFVEFSLARLVRRARRRCRSIIEGWRLERGNDKMALAQHRIDAFLAGGEYSESAREFMGALYLALQRYVPKRYSGNVVLYKVRAEALLRLKEVDRKWRKIAPNLEVIPVGGNHVTVMLEKHVPGIAENLNRRFLELRTMQPRADGDQSFAPLESKLASA